MLQMKSLVLKAPEALARPHSVDSSPCYCMANTSTAMQRLQHRKVPGLDKIPHHCSDVPLVSNLTVSEMKQRREFNVHQIQA